MKKCLVCILLMAILAFVGCASASQSGDTPSAPATVEQESDPFVIVDMSSVESLRQRPRVDENVPTEPDIINRVALETFKKIVEQDKDNQLYSPLSLLYAMAMVAGGADGNTLAQLEEVFGDVDELNAALSDYKKTLGSGEGYNVNVADSIWFNSRFATQINPDFVTINRQLFDAEVAALAFDADATDTINEWVCDKTDGMIERLLSAPLTDGEIAVLVNTILFDCDWTSPYYDSMIRDSTFTCYNGQQTTVRMMKGGVNTYIQGDGAVGFAKQYKGDYYFVGLLPDEGTDVFDYVESLTAESWQAMWADRRNGYLVGYLPQFEYETSMELTAAMKALGITDLFDGDQADLRGIAPGVYISDLMQKAKISVNAQGTKAAAATGFIAEFTSLPPSITLDRPFVYLITDAQGTILFVGVAANL